MREVYVAAYEREGDGWREAPTPAVAEAGRRRRCRPATAGSARATASRRIPSSRALGACARSTRRSSRRARDRRARRCRELAAGDGVDAARRAAAVRAPSRRADHAPSARRALRLYDGDAARASSRSLRRVVWRPLRASDLAYVAALEAQIHAAPWTARQLPRRARRRLQRAGRRARGAHRRVRRADAGAGRSADPESVRRARCAPPGPRPRAPRARSSTTRCALGAEQMLPRGARIERGGDRALRDAQASTRVARRASYYPPTARRARARTRS